MRITAAMLIGIGHLSTLMAQRTDYTCQHWSVRQGLAEHKVSDGIISEDGFYWFTTGNELNRFDGYGFTIFPLHGTSSKEALFPTRYLTSLRGGRMLATSGAYEISELNVVDPHFRSPGMETRQDAAALQSVALPQGVKAWWTLQPDIST
jgi:hypothetical protein